MKADAVLALVMVAIFLLCCTGCASKPDPAPTGPFVAATLDARQAALCVGYIRRSDVPALVPRPSDTAASLYTRKVEDGYAICERVVREGLETGALVTIR